MSVARAVAAAPVVPRLLGDQGPPDDEESSRSMPTPSHLRSSTTFPRRQLGDQGPPDDEESSRSMPTTGHVRSSTFARSLKGTRRITESSVDDIVDILEDKLGTMLQQHHDRILARISMSTYRSTTRTTARTTSARAPTFQWGTGTADLSRKTRQSLADGVPGGGVDSDASESSSQQGGLRKMRSSLGSTFSKVEENMKQKSRLFGTQVVRRSRSGSYSSMALSNLRPKIQKLLETNLFDMFVSALVLSNVAFCGVEVEYSAQTQSDETPKPLFVISSLYAICFTIELLLRMVAEYTDFFWRPNVAWNVFDLLIVAVSWMEILLAGGAGQLSSLRVIRMARVVRVLRVARMIHYFRSLRVLVYSVMGTIRSLLWTMMLLATILYVFGLLFTQAATQHFLSPSGEPIPLLWDAYGTVGRSVFSLFKAISGGVSWQEIVTPLSSLHPVWVAFYIVYFAFTYFAVLNVVTGVFCQTAIESASHDQEVAAHAHMAAEQQHRQQLERLFTAINKNNTGMITLQEFEECMQDGKVRAYFSSLDLTAHEAYSLFKLLDHDQAYVLDISKFVQGCLKLRGTAKSIDIEKMMYETRFFLNKFDKRMKNIEERIHELGVEICVDDPEGDQERCIVPPSDEAGTATPTTVAFKFSSS